MLDEGQVFSGPDPDLRQFLRGLPDGSFYTYLIVDPLGTTFYVGKGKGFRVLEHRLEAMREGGLAKSNPFKCRRIRRIIEAGQTLNYVIDRVYAPSDELACLIREEELIATYRRVCDGGTLTNLAAGLGSLSSLHPFSAERHAATLSGISEERPERTALNLFLQSLGGVDSVPIKPLSEYRGRLVPAYASAKNLNRVSRRNALTLCASALATGQLLAERACLPRAFDLCPDPEEWPFNTQPPERVRAVIENGAMSDVLKVGLATLVAANRPEDESLVLSARQVEMVLTVIGGQQLQAWGLLPATGA